VEFWGWRKNRAKDVIDSDESLNTSPLCHITKLGARKNETFPISNVFRPLAAGEAGAIQNDRVDISSRFTVRDNAMPQPLGEMYALLGWPPDQIR
jgi:hypothetical protein